MPLEDRARGADAKTGRPECDPPVRDIFSIYIIYVGHPVFNENVELDVSPECEISCS